MSDSPEHAGKASASKQEHESTDGGKSMAPPSLQLMAGGEAPPPAGGDARPAQLKAPAFGLSAGPIQAKVIQRVNNPVMDPVTYITGEMIANVAGADVAYIQGELAAASASWNPLTKAERTYNAYKRWYDLVKTGGPWDHKRILRSTYGTWCDDSVTGLSYNYDIWSNVHYGYIGRACGFGEWTLLSGAGAAQVMARTVPDGYWSRRFQTLGDADFLAAFDDPADQAAIRVGFSMWSGYGTAFSPNDLIVTARTAAVRGQLQTQPIAPAAGR